MSQSKKRLSNIYVCGKKSKGHILPATELLISSALTFEVTPHSVYFLTEAFNYARGAWFKFVIINDNIISENTNENRNGNENAKNNGIYRMFVCNGSGINRHSVIFIDALAYILSTRGLGNYPNSTYYPFMKAYNDIISCKDSKEGYVSCKDKILRSKRILNQEIKKHFKCMQVVSAGSGTIFETNDAHYNICLNTKSGHYRPTLKNVEFAKSFLEDIITKIDSKSLRDKIKVSSQYKSSRQTIRKVFGDYTKSKLGICIPKKNKSRKIKNIMSIRDY